MKDRAVTKLIFTLSLNAMFVQVIHLFFCLQLSCCSPLNNTKGLILVDRRADDLLPEISPSGMPQPFLPLLAPSPLAPFTNSTIPKLSGHCNLNFTAVENLMSMTAVDCWAVVAPYMANVICCPQLEATLAILVGQASKSTNGLYLNASLSKNCMSDIENILVSRGASDNLKQICSVHPSNLSDASCLVNSVSEFESTVNSSKLLAACQKIDPVKECCEEVCQNAILEAATGIAMKFSDLLSMDENHYLREHSNKVNDCKSIVIRWLARKLGATQAKEVLRGLSSCNVNKVCPLVFPNMRHVTTNCGDAISNQTACCSSMRSYVSRFQKQSLVTNLQALNCAELLGTKLRKLNITGNVYNLCQISLKDFSLQVGSRESGCLLPSLPSDATFDMSSGISFLCDLNDNIPAPWPSSSKLPASSCNKTIKIPALPAAASSQSCLYSEDLKYYILFAPSLVLMMLIEKIILTVSTTF